MSVERKLFARSALIAVLGVISPASEAFCWIEAAEAYRVDAHLLAAIAKVESRYNPRAYRAPYAAGNRNGTYDLGLMQINSRELPGLAGRGITEDVLLEDPCRNVYEGARILREKIDRVGPTWRAVGAYNAGEKGSQKKQRRYAQAVQIAYDDLLDKPLPLSPSAASTLRSPKPANPPAPPNRAASDASASFVIDVEPMLDRPVEEAPVRDQNDFVFSY